MKKNLTLSPPSSIKEDAEKLSEYCKNNVGNAQKIDNEAVFSLHKAFMKNFKPVKSPLLHGLNLLKLNGLTGTIYGALVICVYFLIGNIIFNI
jgi:hypothetical protein